VAHIHQHLDIYVDGRKVPVPALIGIDPAAGFAPLHVHDTSGVIHVESPTVRSYTLGEFFAVWGVRCISCDAPRKDAHGLEVLPSSRLVAPSTAREQQAGSGGE
jgi:hypothetical protein